MHGKRLHHCVSCPQIYYIWYGDKWDTTSTDYNATPKILTGVSPCSRHGMLGC